MNPKLIAQLIHEATKEFRKEIDVLNADRDANLDEIVDLEKKLVQLEHNLSKWLSEKLSEIHLDMVRHKEQYKGDRGEKGLPGETGEKGDPGRDGMRGKDGNQGLQGKKGPQGIQGKFGEKGDPGLDGTIGKTGPSGKDGSTGLTGEKGDPGLDGMRGKAGNPGLQGDQGLPGKEGKHGSTGRPGDIGLPGKEGKQGLLGDRGEQGLPGKQGKQGTAGEKGDTGLDGQRGKDGKEGKQGDRGEKGMHGATGLPGDQGDQGERGLMTHAIEYRERQHSATEIVTHAGATWQCRHRTLDEPSYNSNSWELMAGSSKSTIKDNVITITSSDGTVEKSENLKGDTGAKGMSVQPPETHSATMLYIAGIHRVKHDGCVWTARKSGILHKPGTKGAKEADQWINDTHRGPQGPAGKDANAEEITFNVTAGLIEHMGELHALAESMVREFFADFNPDDS